jgi:hypothetical protein
MSPVSKDDSSASDFIKFTPVCFVEGYEVSVFVFTHSCFRSSFTPWRKLTQPKHLAPRALLSSGVGAELCRWNGGITRSLPAELLGGNGSVSPFEGFRQTLQRCVKWHARAEMKKPFTNFKGTEPMRSC